MQPYQQLAVIEKQKDNMSSNTDPTTNTTSGTSTSPSTTFARHSPEETLAFRNLIKLAEDECILVSLFEGYLLEIIDTGDPATIGVICKNWKTFFTYAFRERLSLEYEEGGGNRPRLEVRTKAKTIVRDLGFNKYESPLLYYILKLSTSNAKIDSEIRQYYTELLESKDEQIEDLERELEALRSNVTPELEKEVNGNVKDSSLRDTSMMSIETCDDQIGDLSSPPDADADITIMRKKTRYPNANLVVQILERLHEKGSNIQKIADMNCGEGGMTEKIKEKLPKLTVCKFDKFKNKQGDEAAKYNDTHPSYLLSPDCRDFNSHFDVAIWDQPYTSQSGGHTLFNVKDLEKAWGRIGFNDRYGVEYNYSDNNIFAMFKEGFLSGQHILKPDGFLLVKCTDTKTKSYSLEIVCIATKCFNYEHYGTYVLAPSKDCIDVNHGTCSTMLVFRFKNRGVKQTSSISAAYAIADANATEEDRKQLATAKMADIIEQSNKDYQKVAVEKEAAYRKLLLSYSVLMGWLASKHGNKKEFLMDGIKSVGSKYVRANLDKFMEAHKNFAKLKKNFEVLKQLNYKHGAMGGYPFDPEKIYNDLLMETKEE